MTVSPVAKGENRDRVEQSAKLSRVIPRGIENISRRGAASYRFRGVTYRQNSDDVTRRFLENIFGVIVSLIPTM